MCQCIFCDETIDNLATSVSLAGDRMHPECYHAYMDELGEVDPCGGYEEEPYGCERLDSDDWGHDHSEYNEYYDEECPW